MPEALRFRSSKLFVVSSSFAPIPITNSATSGRETSPKSQHRESRQHLEPLKSHLVGAANSRPETPTQPSVGVTKATETSAKFV